MLNGMGRKLFYKMDDLSALRHTHFMKLRHIVILYVLDVP